MVWMILFHCSRMSDIVFQVTCFSYGRHAFGFFVCTTQTLSLAMLSYK